MQLNPCLFFNGSAQEVLEHYRGALGGQVEITRFAGTPAADQVPPDWSGKVLYGVLRSPAGVVEVMDATKDRVGSAGDNFSITIQADSGADADRIFSKLAEGGKVKMPLEKTFWSPKFGMLEDKFGVTWMINCNSNER